MQTLLRRALTASVALAAALTAGGLSSAPAHADTVSPAPYTDCATVTANLIRNCGFETGDFSNWTVTPASGGSNLSLDHNSPHSGSNAALFQAYLGIDDQLSQTIFGTIPGHTYTVGYWLDDALSNSGNHFAVTVSNVQGGGTQTFDEQTDADSGGVDSGWFYNQDTFVAGSTNPTLTFSAYNRLYYWGVDDVTVVDEAAPQTITFTSTPPVNPHRGDTYLVKATGGGSANPVVFVTDPKSKGCTVSIDGLVTFTAIGTCLIDASQAAALPNYLAAQTVQQKIVVQGIPQAITFTSTAPTHAVVTQTYTVTATGGASGNPVLFTTATPTVCSVSNTAANTGSVTFTGAGRCAIKANQAGNTAFAKAPTVRQLITVYAS